MHSTKYEGAEKHCICTEQGEAFLQLLFPKQQCSPTIPTACALYRVSQVIWRLCKAYRFYTDTVPVLHKGLSHQWILVWGQRWGPETHPFEGAGLQLFTESGDRSFSRFCISSNNQWYLHNKYQMAGKHAYIGQSSLAASISASEFCSNELSSIDILPR